jgi:hypothetical protein
MSLKALLLVGLACSLLPAQEEPPAKPAVIPDAEKRALAALVPGARDVGAILPGRTRFYSSDLYEYINGGADPYHDYGLVAMIHQEYKVKDAELTIDVYDMGDALSAFGIYSAERSPDYKFVPIGAEGYGEDQTLNFLQGRYYVKLSVFSQNGGTGPLLQTCARKISEKIGGGKRFPEVLGLFPSKNRMTRSEKFIRKAPLGHNFLEPATTATYSFDGRQTTVVLSLARDAADARARVQQLGKHFTQTGKVAPQPVLAPGATLGSNAYEGEMLFFARGRYMVLVVNPPADRVGLVKELLRTIPSAE